MRNRTAPGARLVRGVIALVIMAVSLGIASVDASAGPALPSHRVNLDSTMLAAQVGSTRVGPGHPRLERQRQRHAPRVIHLVMGLARKLERPCPTD